MRLAFLVATFPLLLACNARSVEPPRAPAKAARASSSVVDGSTGAPEPRASADPPVDPAHVATGPANLLDMVPSRVAVSSTVASPHDFPEYLVDGKPNTAWNSRTGDLGGWIAFDVPEDAHVDRLEITCGYDRVKGRVDLFTANHRITKVAISRNGKPLAEAELDPRVRGLQSIPVDGPGGEYRITVLATLPGSHEAWKELTVSEFRVIGRRGKQVRRADDPVRVVVGALDAEPAELDAEQTSAWQVGAHKDVATLCAAYVIAMKKLRVDERDPASPPDTTSRTPWCVEAPSPVSFASAGPYRSLRAVRTFDGLGTGTTLVVEGPRGFELSPVSWNVDDPRDPGCPCIVRTVSIDEARVDNGYLVIVASGHHQGYTDAATDPDDNGARAELVRSPFWARDNGTSLEFRYYNPQFHPSLGKKTQPRDYRSVAIPWGRLPWTGLKPFHIAPDGTLRVQG